MKAFVTGASGFIGERVAAKLLERGDQVVLLARRPESVGHLAAAGAQVVQGDITEPESMRAAMAGSDVVFHMAGWFKLGTRDRSEGERINLEGTRNVLTLAHSLGVPKIVYTSTVAIFGDTHGFVVDESYVGPNGPFVTEYDRTKHAAHYQVALPLIAQGAPIVIVMPGLVFGPRDYSIIGELLREFYAGRLWTLPGPETMITYAYVDDIADGHIAAAEKGRPGESYILTGPAISVGQLVDLWASVTGKPTPRLRPPAGLVRPLAPVAGWLGRRFSLPVIYSNESLRSLGTTYLARSDKAQRELGWSPRPIREGLEPTVAWLAEVTPPGEPSGLGDVALLLGLALVLRLIVRRRFRHRR